MSTPSQRLVAAAVVTGALTVALVSARSWWSNAVHPMQTSQHGAPVAGDAHAAGTTAAIPAQVQQELAWLRRRLTALEAAKSDTPQAGAVPPIAEDAWQAALDDKTTHSSRDAQDAPASEDAELALDNQAAWLETVFDQDDRDAEWAGDAETQLETVLEAEAFASAVGSQAECQSQLCRIDLRFKDEEARNQAVQAFQTDAPWEGEGFFEAVTDDEGAHAMIYLAREGHDLPRFDS